MNGKRWWRRRAEDPSVAPVPEVRAERGAIAAGRDVVNSVAVYAEQVLPAEAYGPIPDSSAAQAVSNIPVVGLFVGRGDALDALDAAFTGSGGVVLHAVHGMGGVGKSALAAQWAARVDGSLRWWITADSAEAVDAGLAGLARALQPGLAGLPAELQKERAVQWLAGHDGWLVVLDNVEDPDHVRSLLDRVTTGRFLITTRRASGWHRIAATKVRLGVFEPAESVDLFTRILTHDRPRDSSGADLVCAELGHLALAVEQAAAFCAVSGTTPAEYLHMFRGAPTAVIDAADEGAGAERTIARVWRITLDRITANTPLTGHILRVLAWYAPDDIPRDLLDGIAAPHELAHALGLLAAYNMATHHDRTLAVHRLVQTLARTPDPDDPHRRPADIALARDHATSRLGQAFPHDIEEPEHWPRYRALLPHADALARRSSPDDDDLGTAYLLTQAAGFHQQLGAPAPAVTYALRVHATLCRILGEHDAHTLACQGNLALAYAKAGDLAQAIRLHERTLADAERVLGADHPQTLLSRLHLAATYESAGDFARAIPLCGATLAGHVRVLGDDHPQTLMSRGNLAAAHQQAGDLTRAVPLFEQTFAGFGRVFGADHPYTLAARSNLANAYRLAGDLTRATPLLEQAVTDRVRVLGNDHPDTLSSRNNLAAAYATAGDTTRAVSVFEQILADAERVLAADHPSTLTARSNLANAYRLAGDLTRATPLLKQALADSVRVLGHDHPETLRSRNALAVVYRDTGDLSRAIALFEQAVSENVRVLGDDHPETLVSRGNLAVAYTTAGDPAQAIRLHEQTFADAERVLGADHPDTFRFRNNLALAYESAGGLTRAIPLYEQTVADRVRVLGADHPDTLQSMRVLALAYDLADDQVRALRVYEQALVGCERVLGPQHPTTAEVRALLEIMRETQ